jgi:DNA repair exonuclease SbcCD ATPase subunit
LACEEYIIHEYQKEKNGEVPTLEKISLKLIKLKSDAEKYHDVLAERVYWPLINAVLVVVYSSIAKKKYETYIESISKSKKVIFGFEAEMNDNHGKIVMLEEVRSRIMKNSNFTQQNKEVEEEIQDEEEVGDDVQGYENNLNEISDEIARITEELKQIKNEQENNFYEYLKEVSKSLVHQKALKKM